MRDILIETAENILPKEKKRKRQKWMTEEILLMMEDRQKLRDRQGSGYRELDKLIKKKCREAKENWLNDQCAELKEQLITTTEYTKGLMKSQTGSQVV